MRLYIAGAIIIVLTSYAVYLGLTSGGLRLGFIGKVNNVKNKMGNTVGKKTSPKESGKAATAVPAKSAGQQDKPDIEALGKEFQDQLRFYDANSLDDFEGGDIDPGHSANI